jgi:dCTP deaminase
MILTGDEIAREVNCGRIHISPFSADQVEPNSYGFRLGSDFMYYDALIVDALQERPPEVRFAITESGHVLEPGRFYLGRTLETMGSDHYAATLYARRSVSTMGMWIQFSAPLGHTGAIIPWTLEITVAHQIIVYPGMLIGKIAFWRPMGPRLLYAGKYSGSSTVVPSRMYDEVQGGASGDLDRPRDHREPHERQDSH